MSSDDDNKTPVPKSDNDPINDATVLVDIPEQLGAFKLTRLLGRGGMGEVWMGFDTNLERNVALKLMRKELLANQEAVKRFGREARAVARLNHPNIVQVYTFGEEKALTYFVMEMVEGDTIADILKAKKQIALEEAVRILIQAIEGLDYAYARGIIHRDIKPANLMLTPDFRVKIADFGLAKMVEHDTQMTAAGTTMGSPNYMSPEQAKGIEADHRSDIYALGITFYQMLSGELPFTAQSPLTVLLKHIQDPLPEPVVLKEMQNGRVFAVIQKMTEKNPDDRYQDYQGLAAALASLTPSIQYHGSHFATGPITIKNGTVSEDLPGSADIIASAGNATKFQNSAVSEAPVIDGTQSTGTSGTHVSESEPTPIAVPIKEKRENETGGGGLPLVALITGLALASTGGVWWYSNNSGKKSAESPETKKSIVEATPAPTPQPTPTPSPTPVATPVPTMRVAPVYTPVPTVRPSLTPSLNVPAVPKAVAKYRLGTQGGAATEQVPVYLDAMAKMEFQKLPAGSTVDFVSEELTSYKVKLPTGKDVYVLKKMASPAE